MKRILVTALALFCLLSVAFAERAITLQDFIAIYNDQVIKDAETIDIRKLKKIDSDEPFSVYKTYIGAMQKTQAELTVHPSGNLYYAGVIITLDSNSNNLSEYIQEFSKISSYFCLAAEPGMDKETLMDMSTIPLMQTINQSSENPGQEYYQSSRKSNEYTFLATYMPIGTTMIFAYQVFFALE